MEVVEFGCAIYAIRTPSAFIRPHYRVRSVGHVCTVYLLCNPICYNIFAGDKDGLITAYSFMDDTHLGM